MYRIEVSVREGFTDPRAEGLLKDILDLGITAVRRASVSNVYLLEGNLDENDLLAVGRELLADPIVEEFATQESPCPPDARLVEVAYNPGVMDPVEESVMKGIRDLGIDGVTAVRTAKKYLLWGGFSEDILQSVCDKLLVNSVVQHIVARREAVALPPATYRFKKETIDLKGMGDGALMALSKGRFWLNIREMRIIQDYFKKVGRDPTDVELETLAQTWSEHCIHKTFKARIKLGGKVIDNLMKSTVMRVTEELNKPWCLSVFRDNAGVIDFDGRHAVCFKVETHNHPSAVEPYGGAATGIGGVIRDPLGTGLGAKPIANTDVFCFGPPDLPHAELPRGVLHPRRIFKGVRAGVADYGNRMGIATLNGAVLFDQRYVGNPLVFCGTVGLMPADMSQRGVQRTGDLVVLVGGRTGRDGIHGVTFASGELNKESETISSSSVQIGNPIVEKKALDAILKARDAGLYRRITDCGGGGLSSAVGEMGEDTGVRVHLEKVPLKYAGLSYTEIWVSESQERMLLAAPPDKVERLLELFRNDDVEATVIGEFTDNRRLELYYNGHPVADLDMDFLHHGLPQLEREALWEPPSRPEPDFPPPPDLAADLKKILGAWNVCSKEWVIRQYDHEVQGSSVLKPLVGASGDGPGDAAVIRPLPDSDIGIIIANGINPKYGDIDTYWMAASAIDEALRQVVAVGGSLEEVALLDNFCWGNPEKPDRLGQLVRAARACYDTAIVYGTPFISGKDSLYNEYETGKESICIPPTLLISAMGVMKDVNRAVTMDCKQAGDLIYIVGDTRKELGGSHYYAIRGHIGSRVPKVYPETGKKLMDALSSATAKGLVRACHDCSEGGIGVAAAEMAFAGGLGMTLNLKDVPLAEPIERDDLILFAESNSRFLVEVSPEKKKDFQKAMSGTAFAEIGRVTDGGAFEVYGRDGKKILQATISELKEAWQKPLKW
ncbi:MAG TPA: phosphoribosylformylglycinamidine synthase subunit PurL [Dehalococcoidales bacterium]|nr:phosphoribosylformylglycinamidine synthase subunit PurL [Dehalococcoidales bacterium]